MRCWQQAFSNTASYIYIYISVNGVAERFGGVAWWAGQPSFLVHAHGFLPPLLHHGYSLNSNHRKPSTPTPELQSPYTLNSQLQSLITRNPELKTLNFDLPEPSTLNP